MPVFPAGRFRSLYGNLAESVIRKKLSLLRHTIAISNREAIFFQLFGIVGAPGSMFVTKFAILLGAAPIHFGILAALGQLSQIFQPFGVALTRGRTSRRHTVVSLYGFARLITFGYGFLPFLVPSRFAILAFLLLLLLSYSLQAMGLNGWIAWITDIVPIRYRGRFFSLRSRFLMLSGLIGGFVLGAFIDIFDENVSTGAGMIRRHFAWHAFFSPGTIRCAFLVIFAVASVFGVVGLLFLLKQPERAKEIEGKGFWRIMVIPLRDGNFRRLMLYGIWWMFAIGIGAPFWQPFMIQKLGMSLVKIQLYGAVHVLSCIASLRLWGLFIDRFGNKTAMRAAIVLGGFNPLIWLLATREMYFFVYLEAITSGIMWAGAGVVATNFVLAIAPDRHRQIYSGVFGAFCGLAMMTTMFLSGLLLPPSMKIGNFYLEPEQVLFGISGVARWTAQVPITWVQEPRAKAVSAVLYAVFQGTKVRIANIFSWLRRR
jgi:MFS family permease